MNHSTTFQSPIPPNDETIIIPLTKGYATVIDAFDVDLCQYRWHAHIDDKGKHTVYAVRGVRANYVVKTVWLHRVILERKLGVILTSKQLCDHVDRDGLNNKRDNLRLANHVLNGQNHPVRSDNTSGVPGVVWNRKDRCWDVKIRVNGKRLYLGGFKDYDKAVEVRRQAETDYFGEFASRDRLV